MINQWFAKVGWHNAVMRVALSTFVLLVWDSIALAQAPKLDADVLQAMQQLSIDSIRQHLNVLAHDSLQGRATGTPGSEKAIRYLALHLKKYGIEPAHRGSSYFQNIPLHGAIPQPESELALHAGDTTIPLQLWQDYILYNTGAQTFSPTPIQMVFVGYGIFAPEYDYNDYYDLDVTNKVVVFFSGEPGSDDPDYFDGKKPSRYADPVMKHRIALSRGARGSIMIPLPRERIYLDWAYWRDQFAFEEVRLPYNVADNLNVLLRYEQAQHLFRGASHDLESVLEFERVGAMRSFPLAVEVTFRGQFKERDFVARNVVGIVQGSDHLLRDEFVLLSAHFDHLGVGAAVKGDSIYNGVVDNAIGAAAVLEMARVFAAMPKPPRRSVLFLFADAEEKGLLGSRFYCDQPLVPLYKTIAAVNVDGLAIMDTFDSINSVGPEYSTLGEHLQTVATALDLFVDNVPSVFREIEFFHRSDQFSFAQAGIPAILIMEGHEYRNLPSGAGVRRFIMWGREIYHTPFDDLNQDINFAATLQHAQFIFAFTGTLANTFVPPQWKPGTVFSNARLQSIAEKR